MKKAFILLLAVQSLILSPTLFATEKEDDRFICGALFSLSRIQGINIENSDLFDDKFDLDSVVDKTYLEFRVGMQTHLVQQFRVIADQIQKRTNTSFTFPVASELTQIADRIQTVFQTRFGSSDASIFDLRLKYGSYEEADEQLKLTFDGAIEDIKVMAGDVCPTVF